MQSSDVTMPDGSRPTANTPIVCGGCLVRVTPRELSFDNAGGAPPAAAVTLPDGDSSDSAATILQFVRRATESRSRDSNRTIEFPIDDLSAFLREELKVYDTLENVTRTAMQFVAALQAQGVKINIVSDQPGMTFEKSIENTRKAKAALVRVLDMLQAY